MATASGIEATLPFFGERARLAILSTAMTSATSDSTACTTSETEGCSSRTSLSRGLRDSAGAGNASRASNAAVSRRPWPSLYRDRTATASGGVIWWGSRSSGAIVVSILGHAGTWDCPGGHLSAGVNRVFSPVGGLARVQRPNGREFHRDPGRRRTRRFPATPLYPRWPHALAGRRPWASRPSRRPRAGVPARRAPRRTDPPLRAPRAPSRGAPPPPP